MNRLSIERRTQILGRLLEGMSLRATARLSGASLNTVTKLMVETGAACQKYHDANIREIRANRIECDEIWAFVGSKQKNVPADKEGYWGDVWTWTAIDPDSKLIVSYLVGARDAGYAHVFTNDVADRLVSRVQLTADGNRLYLNAVEDASGSNVDYAMLEKHYGSAPGGHNPASVRYSPATVTSISEEYVCGTPDPQAVSTSIVERQNLTMRMHMRRFTRLTNGFSKKIENHASNVGLYFMFYNFVKIHKSLRVTPAMEAGISDHVWSLGEIAALSN